MARKTQIGGFKVMPFKLYHNCECIGFLIECGDGTRIVFATDTCKIPYKFKRINTFLVEANYSYDILFENSMKGQMNMSASENHMEIRDTIDFLKANETSYLSDVVLIHLSNGNSNKKKFIEMAKEALYTKHVYVAEEGLEIDLNEYNF